ncbi:MarR family winged helix-turn-helix transcriptional regulator [Cohnella zeiphila]|uniref:MarR family transcriptional regulator n=1 Tax=Cohnella zeiphila TaxID=2761120 RepID=A0A7X0SL87_9BACL|nr:MarR family transcriptional regulator [Cohnella zeiphila]MBB6732077.1 MarR family transcriptional regulator [Cohnella zeiphila]
MEDARLLLQHIYKHFGLLNKNCCTVGSQEVSLIQSQILYEIDRQHQPSMQQIASALGVDITAFSHQIQTLIRKKLVAKQASEADKRVYILSLTTEGKFVATVIDEQISGYLSQVFEGMSEPDKETVIQGLKILSKSMEKIPVCCG